MIRTHELSSLLLTQAWQIAVLILLVMLFVRLFARSRPYLAPVLWLVVLLKCLTPPLWSSPAGVFCWLQPPSHSQHEIATDGSAAPRLTHRLDRSNTGTADGDGRWPLVTIRKLAADASVRAPSSIWQLGRQW